MSEDGSLNQDRYNSWTWKTEYRSLWGIDLTKDITILDARQDPDGIFRVKGDFFSSEEETLKEMAKALQDDINEMIQGLFKYPPGY